MERELAAGVISVLFANCQNLEDVMKLGRISTTSMPLMLGRMEADAV